MLICFDLDDTLFDHGSAQEAAAEQFGKAYRDQLVEFRGTFADTWRAAAERHVEVFLRGDISFQEQRRRRIHELITAELSDDKADELFSVYLEIYEANWTLFDDVKGCLAELTDKEPGSYQLGIITNGSETQQLRKLETLGISTYFDFVLSADSVGTAKPHPAMFQRAKQLTRLTKLVYIGDNLTIDAEAATHAGWHGVWLDRRRLGPATTLPTVHTLRDLPALIRNL